MTDERRPHGAGRRLWEAVILCSVFVNLLMLTGPLYMLQVYDRVLTGRSLATLAALSALAAFLFLLMGLFDHARARMLTRVGATLQAEHDSRNAQALVETDPQRLHAPATLARALSAPVAGAVLDLPWSPFFIVAIFLFHPWLGALALGGSSVLIGLGLLHMRLARKPGAEALARSSAADRAEQALRAQGACVAALGMGPALGARWLATRRRALLAGLLAADISGAFMAAARTLRLFLQSAMLGLGALLVLGDLLSPGAMIAASILLGRALAPVEAVIGQWSLVQAALRARARLALPPPATRARDRTPANLPRPSVRLQVAQVTLVPPGARRAALRMVSFDLGPGEVLGVVGIAGAGKSALLAGLAGAWPAAGGQVRLDGIAIARQAQAGHVGYLPQETPRLAGTLAEVIARGAFAPDMAGVTVAARAADIHDTILRLPDGYDTDTAEPSCALSSGQTRRAALARALFGDPPLLVLDTPDSHLDRTGRAALCAAIARTRAAGGSVVLATNSDDLLRQCDRLLWLDEGSARALGPTVAVQRMMASDTAAGPGPALSLAAIGGAGLSPAAHGLAECPAP